MRRIRAKSSVVLPVCMLLVLLVCAIKAPAEPRPTGEPGRASSASPSGAASPPASSASSTASPAKAPTPPRPSANPHKHVSLRADRLIHGEHKTFARGHAVAITEAAYIEGDEIEVDHDADMLYARKNVVVRMGGDQVHAEAASYDLKRGIADLQDAYGIARNITLYHKSIEDSLYFWSPRVRWDGKVLRLIKGVMTTCDLPAARQHYKITGNVINVYPNDRMEIRKGRVFLNNKQILGRELLVFSLRPRQRQSLVPGVGYNTRDGLYVKESLSFTLGPQTYGRVFADLFQKTGVGHGVELAHSSEKVTGNFYFYELAAPPKAAGRYELRNTTVFRLSPSMSGVFLYQGDRFDTPDRQLFTPTSRLMGLYLYDSGPRHSLSLITQFFNSGVIGTTFQPITNKYYAVIYRQAYTDRLSNYLDVSYSQSRFDIYNSYFVHALDRLSYRAPLFDADLLVEKTAFTGTPIFLVNRVPEVVVRSRLFNVGPVPLRVSLSAGRFEEQPSGTHVGRADLKLAVPDTYYPVGDRGSILFGAGFRQLFYDNGDSQYVSALRADWIQDLGKHWRTHVDYRLQRGEGFTPIQSDFYGQYNSLSGGLEYHDRDRLFLGIDAGYDFLYRRNYGLRARLMVKPYRDMRVDLGTSFDLDKHEPQLFNSRVKIPLSPSLNVQHYALYDFVNHRLAYQDFMIQGESHDFLTSLIYRGVQKEFFLQVDIKSFPFRIPSVGPTDDHAILPRTPLRGFRRDTFGPVESPTPPR